VERKLATVLFVDLVDSTALVTGTDPEVVRRRVQTFFDRVSHCVITHGGIVEKFAGDAVMAAFGIPITAFTVFLVASSHMLSGIFAITPGGVGQTQALDVATLRSVAPTGSVAAFSITQDSILAVWNVLLGLTLMLWVFGFSQVKALLSRKPTEQPDGRADVEAPKA